MLLYVGLLKEDGTEPSPASGYFRPYTSEFDAVPELAEFQQFLFPDAVGPGYGIVTRVALFDAAEGGEPLKVMELPESVDVHADTVPFLHNGKLLRGVAVQAKSLIRTKSVCNC